MQCTVEACARLAAMRTYPSGHQSPRYAGLCAMHGKRKYRKSAHLEDPEPKYRPTLSEVLAVFQRRTLEFADAEDFDTAWAEVEKAAEAWYRVKHGAKAAERSRRWRARHGQREDVERTVPVRAPIDPQPFTILREVPAARE